MKDQIERAHLDSKQHKCNVCGLSKENREYMSKQINSEISKTIKLDFSA